jgi:hypothetical protein
MNDDRQPAPHVDATAMPRVDADSEPDAGADLVWPPPPEDLAACAVVPMEGAELDQKLLLIGGFPMAEADPRLRPKPIGVFFPPATIGGFPVREEEPFFAAPPPVPRPVPPPLPEFASAVEPPPLPAPPSRAPSLEPAAVAAAPLAIAAVVPQPIASDAITSGPIAAEPLAPEPLAPAVTAAAPVTVDTAAAAPVAPELVAVASDGPARIDTATIERLFTSTGMWGVRRVEAIRRPVEMAALLREPSPSMAARRRATVAVLVAASLALVSWSEYRAQRQIGPEVPVSASATPPAPEPAAAPVPAAATPVTAGEPEPDVVPEPIATPAVPDPPAPKVARRERRDDDEDRDEPLRPTMHRVAAHPVRWPSRPAVLPSMPTRPLPAPYAAPRLTTTASLATAPTPAPASAASSTASSSSSVAAPVPMRAAATPAVVNDTPAPLETSVRLPSEEDNVRATLTRWRTAYSQLDARAAKGVYPGLDQRALERAFQNLKSQEVRFDHCELTLRDGTARADCIGRATYVPRIGSQTPITAPRAWRFDLKRHDEGWTIASARSS